jgi:hypothetical protein
MSRRGLEFLAVFLAFLIVVVLLAGFDNLPRKLRADIAAETQKLPQTEQQFQTAREEVTRDLAADPDLFRAREMNTVFPDRLRIAGKELEGARKDATALGLLLKKNRRQDAPQAERLLNEERTLAAAAVKEASLVQADAQHWIDMKRHLPEEMQQMAKDHEALDHTDFGPITAAVQKAEADWPAKKADLDARLAALRAMPAQADTIWVSSEPLRRQAASKDLAGLDYGTLLSDVQSLHDAESALPARITELQSLSGQLYTSWDKVLVDLQDRKSGGTRDYEEKIRTVRTRYPDASGTQGETTSEEAWVEVPHGTYEVNEKNIGMAIAHKPVGKYDLEADQVPEPAGFAYMAPLSQQRNQYGYWERRDGGNFWVWYGQYALLRDLLWGHSYRPIPSGEWQQYRNARSYGQTYYGRDESAGAPRYGTHGTFTQKHYSDSRYVRSSGGYGSSRYATGGFRRGQGSEGRTFGSRSPGSSYRPRSTPHFRMPSGGRTFGRHR